MYQKAGYSESPKIAKKMKCKNSYTLLLLSLCHCVLFFGDSLPFGRTRLDKSKIKKVCKAVMSTKLMFSLAL